AWHAPAAIEDPPRQASRIQPQSPSLAISQIHERELSRRRARKASSGADRLEISERGMVAGKQKMIAIVDHHIEQRGMVGPATASRRAGGLVQDDGDPPRGKTPSGGKPRQPRSGDGNRPRRQMNPWRRIV